MLRAVRTTGTKPTSRRVAGAAGVAVLLALTACSGNDQERVSPPAPETEDAATADDSGNGSSEEEATSGPDEVTETSSDDETAEPPADAAAESEGPLPEPEASTGGPAPYAEGEDPCAGIVREDLAEAVGSQLGDRLDEGPDSVTKQLEASEGGLVNCFFPSEEDAGAGVAIWWRRLGGVFPDEMPEDVRAEHERSMHVNVARGQDDAQEVEVPGVPEAYATVTTGWGTTQVSVYVPFDDALLVATLVGDEGSLDEGDFPQAVQAAQVAFAQP